jgi:hypothetical protein
MKSGYQGEVLKNLTRLSAGLQKKLGESGLIHKCTFIQLEQWTADPAVPILKPVLVATRSSYLSSPTRPQGLDWNPVGKQNVRFQFPLLRILGLDMATPCSWCSYKSRLPSLVSRLLFTYHLSFYGP